MSISQQGAQGETPSSTPGRLRSVIFIAIALAVLIGVIAVVISRRGGSPTAGDPDVTTTPTTAPTSASAAGGGDVIHDTMTFDDVERFFRVYVPPSLSADSTVPLLIALHGNGTDEDSFAEITGLDEKAAEEGFVVVYPRALDGVWNGGFEQRPRDVDDVGFIKALVAELSGRYSIDGDRVFATGLSAGGIMTYRLACEAPELVAAIAPVAATMAVECSPDLPVSVLHIHGTDDPAIPIEGLPNRGAPPIATVVEEWSAIDGCSPDPQVQTEGATSIEDWTGCADGTAVQFDTVEGMRHEYPRTDDGDAIDARDVTWAFFTEHARTPGA